MSDQAEQSGSAQLHHYDDPRSQIRFLELTLGDREWRARIHLPPASDKAADIMRELRRHGYKVTPAQEEDGSQVLELHHFGKAPDIPSLFRRYGLTYGAGYLIENPSQALRAAGIGLNGAAQNATAITRDPARLNGLTYLTAEAFLMRAAGGNPHGKWYHPKNLLQGISATFYMSQSLAYMFWARKGHDRIEADLKKQLSKSENGEFDALADALPLNERIRPSAIGKVRAILEDHPIESGAMLNNAGMAAYISHALLERRHRLEILKTNPNDIKALNYVKKGFWAGIIGSTVSVAGWSSLLLKSKSYEEYSDNPIVRLYQKWRENPQSTAGASTLISSSGRLMEAYNKGNSFQMIGESIYIPGDIMLFFVKNHEYGGSIGDNLDGLSERIADLLMQQPMIISPEMQPHLYEQTAHYMTKQISALTHNPVDEKHTFETLCLKLKESCNQPLTQRFEDMTAAAQRLIAAYPRAQQETVAAQLQAALAKMTMVHASPQELESRLNHNSAASTATHPPSEAELSRHIGELALSISAKHAGQNTLALLSALSSTNSSKNSHAPTDRIDAQSAHLQETAHHLTGAAPQPVFAKS